MCQTLGFNTFSLILPGGPLSTLSRIRQWGSMIKNRSAKISQSCVQWDDLWLSGAGWLRTARPPWASSHAWDHAQASLTGLVGGLTSWGGRRDQAIFGFKETLNRWRRNPLEGEGAGVSITCADVSMTWHIKIPLYYIWKYIWWVIGSKLKMYKCKYLWYLLPANLHRRCWIIRNHLETPYRTLHRVKTPSLLICWSMNPPAS